jgi:hypothetical protein
MDEENQQLDPEQLEEMVNNQIQNILPIYLRNYLQNDAFFIKKVTDTPTDNLQVVNRKYVTLNGITANRPTSSVTGQRYFDTTIGRPVYWQGTKWVDGAGSVS